MTPREAEVAAVLHRINTTPFDTLVAELRAGPESSEKPLLIGGYLNRLETGRYDYPAGKFEGENVLYQAIRTFINQCMSIKKEWWGFGIMAIQRRAYRLLTGMQARNAEIRSKWYSIAHGTTMYLAVREKLLDTGIDLPKEVQWPGYNAPKYIPNDALVTTLVKSLESLRTAGVTEVTLKLGSSETTLIARPKEVP